MTSGKTGKKSGSIRLNGRVSGRICLGMGKDVRGEREESERRMRSRKAKIFSLPFCAHTHSLPDSELVSECESKRLEDAGLVRGKSG